MTRKLLRFSYKRVGLRLLTNTVSDNIYSYNEWFQNT